jgi:hypothetical protein
VRRATTGPPFRRVSAGMKNAAPTSQRSATPNGTAAQPNRRAEGHRGKNTARRVRTARTMPVNASPAMPSTEISGDSATSSRAATTYNTVAAVNGQLRE